MISRIDSDREVSIVAPISIDMVVYITIHYTDIDTTLEYGSFQQ